jgi:hypothetical protein
MITLEMISSLKKRNIQVLSPVLLGKWIHYPKRGKGIKGCRFFGCDYFKYGLFTYATPTDLPLKEEKNA